MVIQSVFAQTDEGYERIEYTSSNVLIEGDSNDHQLLRTKEIPLSLPIFDAFMPELPITASSASRPMKMRTMIWQFCM